MALEKSKPSPAKTRVRIAASDPARAARLPAMRNKQGQSIGSKGSGTRKRLMQAAESLLLTESPLRLTAVSIASLAKTSPATFYMYFDDVRDVLLALAEAVLSDSDPVLAILDEEWNLSNLDAQAVRLVEALAQFWDRHREVLRYRNLEADRGDADFLRLRMEAFIPFIENLASRIIACCPPGQAPSRGDARAIASVLHCLVERANMEDPESVRRSVGTVRHKSAQARVLTAAISGLVRNFQPLDKG